MYLLRYNLVSPFLRYCYNKQKLKFYIQTHDPAEKTPLPDPEKFWPCNDEEYEKHLLRAEIDRGEKPSVSGRRRYTQSKLSNIFFTNELAKRLTSSLPAYLEETVKAELQATLTLDNKVRKKHHKNMIL